MKITKSIAASRALMVVVIALCIIGGGVRSLGRESRKAQEAFFTVDDHGQSGQADFGGRLAESANLLVVASRYLDEADSAYTDLDTALSQGEAALEAGDIYAMAQADSALEAAFNRVALLLDEAGLSEQDASYLAGFRDQFVSYGYTLRHNVYNTQATAFNQEVLGAFPARVWAGLFQIEPLPVFS